MDKEIEYKASDELQKIDITVMLNDYFYLLLKKWKMIVVFLIVGAIFLVTFNQIRYKPVYTASVTYAVYSSQNDKNSYHNDATVKQMVESFPYILTSGVLERKVAQSLGVSSVSGEISAKVAENTNFLTLSVCDSDPQMAYRTLQAVIQNYPEISERIIGKVIMELLDETGMPVHPDNPISVKKDVLIGMTMGLILACIILVISLVTRKTIRREEDCKKKINKKCLGDIPQIQMKERSQKKEFYPIILQKNIEQQFINAFQILCRKVEHEAEKNKAKSIMITSTIPGEGKSTIAVNLALALAKNGKKVTLIDADLRNPSDAGIFGIKGKKGTIDFLTNRAKLSECIMRGEMLKCEKLPFLLINGGESVEDGASILSNGKMENLIQNLEEKMDYVIIDTPPIGLITDASIIAPFVDGAIFVVRKDCAASTGILDAMEHLRGTQAKIWGCVLNGR